MGLNLQLAHSSEEMSCWTCSEFDFCQKSDFIIVFEIIVVVIVVVVVVVGSAAFSRRGGASAFRGFRISGVGVASLKPR